MIPDVTTVLNGIARSLMMDIGPEVTTPYGALNIQLASALLAMIGQDAERAAERLVEENDAVASLLADGVRIVDDAALSDALQSAIAQPAASLRVSDLRQRNRTLRELLIRLHAGLETRNDPPARALEQRIWAELASSVSRRQLDLAIG